MELNEEELDKVLAGNLHQMSEESALKNPNLFRDKQIEELKKEKERLESYADVDLEKDDISKTR